MLHGHLISTWVVESKYPMKEYDDLQVFNFPTDSSSKVKQLIHRSMSFHPNCSMIDDLLLCDPLDGVVSCTKIKISVRGWMLSVHCPIWMYIPLSSLWLQSSLHPWVLFKSSPSHTAFHSSILWRYWLWKWFKACSRRANPSSSLGPMSRIANLPYSTPNSWFCWWV